MPIASIILTPCIIICSRLCQHNLQCLQPIEGKKRKFAGILIHKCVMGTFLRNVADTIFIYCVDKNFFSMETKGGGYVVVYIRAKMFYSGKSLSDGKNQSLSAKVRELWQQHS